ncbi:M64 family metallopeptidase [Pelagicoccus sp. SDUM812003]|uniref:M64 family metallopeptidase n=1 Tax=Pelagicoccus sp. SDUM812003 TaxID=3041267 RepID=UPI00280DB3FE|nr:M64 family metallopeptidase [Pelagicoccus sp. SDUM812003]MDQ8205800.1 M64 family metallopeptidase [Pelagicoccus sp. SDUM812003]
MKTPILLLAASLSLCASLLGEPEPHPAFRASTELGTYDPLPELGIPGQRELPVKLPAEYDTRTFKAPGDPRADPDFEFDHGAIVYEEVNGPRSNRIDLCFVSEGYTTEEEFLRMFKRVILDGLFGRVEPFKSYRNRFNIYAFHANSLHDGAVPRDKLGELYNNYGTDFGLIPSNDYYGTASYNNPVPLIGNYDVNFLLVRKNQRYDRSGGAGPVAAVAAIGEAKKEGYEDDDVAAVAHEIGHVLGALQENYAAFKHGFGEPNENWYFWDLYELPAPTVDINDQDGAGRPPIRNIHYNNLAEDRSNLPWKHWIEPDLEQKFGSLPWDQHLSAWNSDIFEQYTGRPQLDPEVIAADPYSKIDYVSGTAVEELRNKFQNYELSRTFDEEAYNEYWPVGMYAGAGGYPFDARAWKPNIATAMDNKPIAFYGDPCRELIMLRSVLNMVFPFENLTSPNVSIRIGNDETTRIQADLVDSETVDYWFEIDGQVFEGEIEEFEREIRFGEYATCRRLILDIDPSELGIRDRWVRVSLKSYDNTPWVRRDPRNLRAAQHDWALKVGDPENERPVIVNRKFETYFGGFENTPPP